MLGCQFCGELTRFTRCFRFPADFRCDAAVGALVVHLEFLLAPGRHGSAMVHVGADAEANHVHDLALHIAASDLAGARATFLIIHRISPNLV